MRPQFEHVTIPPGESWSLLWRELPELPFLWHYHPEFELTLTLNARGQRYVADSLETFEPGDLVLVGPNQPHTWAARERPDDGRPILAVVAWFGAEWLRRLVDGWPELAGLAALARDAQRSLRFSATTAAQVQPLMLALRGQETAVRLPQLIHVLALLARDRGARPLATHGADLPDDKSQHRLGKVFDRLHANLSNPPPIAELAALAALSEGAFHRFFKRHTGLTVLGYVAQLRVGAACQMLISSDRAIGAVAQDAGYGTAAHFNRQFLALKGTTPREFRALHRG